MIRHSIHKNRERFNQVLKEIHKLVEEEEKPKDEIPQLLSERYQEREIKKLLTSISNLHILAKHQRLKTSLKASLAFLLFGRLLLVPPVLVNLDIGVFWKLVVFVLSFVFIAAALALLIKQNPHCYLFTLGIMAFYMAGSSESLLGGMEFLLTSEPLTMPRLFQLLLILSFGWAFFASWRLMKLQPQDVLNVAKSAGGLGLEFRKLSTINSPSA